MLGSGTISGGVPGTRGCFLEATSGGREPLVLHPKECIGLSRSAPLKGSQPDEVGSAAAAEEDGLVKRTWLEDGDEVVLSGFCRKGEDGEVVSFGECRGILLPSLSNRFTSG